MDTTDLIREKAKDIYRKRMEEGDLLVAKFILDNPSISAEDIVLEGFWSESDSYTYVMRVRGRYAS